MQRLFLMNDDYGTVVYAKDEETAEIFFKSTFDGDIPKGDYCSVKREIDPSETAVFEEIGEMTWEEWTQGLDDDEPAIAGAHE